MVEIIQGIIDCNISGFSPKIHTEIRKALSYEDRSLSIMRAMTKKRQGYIPKWLKSSLICVYNENNNSFPTGLLEKVLSVLDNNKIPYNITKDYKENLRKEFIPFKEDLNLWEHQEQAMKAMIDNKIGLISASTSAGKCVTPDTWIWSNGLKQIKDIYKKESTITTEKGEKRIINWHDDSIKPGLKITNSLGWSIDGTNQHRIWHLDIDGNQKWEYISNLKVGDYIGIYRGNHSFGKNHLDFNEAFTLGLLIADCYTNRGVLQVDKHINLLNYILPTIKKWSEPFDTKNEPFIVKHSENHWQLSSFSYLWLSFFKKKFGIDWKLSYEKSIPNYILESDKETVSAFLQGYFQGDGWIDKNIHSSSSSKILSEQVSQLLLGLGIINGIKVKKIPGYRDANIVTVFDFNKFDSEIGFINFNILKNKNYEKLKITSLKEKTNIDLIPNIGRYIKEYIFKLRKHNPGIIKQKPFSYIRNYYSNNRKLSYSNLKNLLNTNFSCEEKEYLQSIYDEKYFWSKIEKIEKSEVYRIDCEVEEVHSYIGNGFINHNTKLSVKACQDIGEYPFLFVVNRITLLEQTYEDYQRYFDEEIGWIGDGRIEVKKINIATIGTLCSILNIELKSDDEKDENLSYTDEQINDLKKLLKDCRFLIGDEVHHFASATYQKLIKNMPNCQRKIGLSATVYRADGADILLEAVFGKIIYRIGASELIRKNIVCQPEITFVEYKDELTKKYPPSSTDKTVYGTIVKECITENEYYNELVCKLAIINAEKGRKTMVAVSRIKHGESILKAFENLNCKFNIVFLNGQNKKKLGGTKKVFDDFSNGKIDILLTNLCEEGVSIPAIDAIVDAAPSASSIRAIQLVGRGMRKYPGKKKAHIYFLIHPYKFLKKQTTLKIATFQEEEEFILKHIKI